MISFVTNVSIHVLAATPRGGFASEPRWSHYFFWTFSTSSSRWRGAKRASVTTWSSTIRCSAKITDVVKNDREKFFPPQKSLIRVCVKKIIIRAEKTFFHSSSPPITWQQCVYWNSVADEKRLGLFRRRVPNRFIFHGKKVRLEKKVWKLFRPQHSLR